jgi:inhibitor of KinA
MSTYHPYTIFPLGDSALTIDFGNLVDENINKKLITLFRQLRQHASPKILDIIPAYSSLTVYYDVAAAALPGKSAFEVMAGMIEGMTATPHSSVEESSNLFEIPVCYAEKFAPDMAALAAQKGLSVREVIQIHTGRTYRVYMLGFLPGFAYMGTVDERISLPRKQDPRSKVLAGAVGIAGNQTGIYPLESPGGWQIIGRTPMQIFNRDKERPVLLQAGDSVNFYSITENEFENYQTRHT